MGQRFPDYIAGFDSVTSLLRATARYLHGKDFPRVGFPWFMGPLIQAANHLPEGLRTKLYALGGAREAIPPDRLTEVAAEEIARWMVSEYPARRYPAVMIGSPNGAAVHLCTALGIPWLSQTTLIPVRRDLDPDDLGGDVHWARAHAQKLLDANPDLQLHQMHDPNQDRLMIRRMAYFRVKRLCLGATLESFLHDCLEPGGTVLLLECEQTWPTTRLGERHVFQAGGVAALRPEEYLEGSRRVAEFLERHGSPWRSWDAPEPDADRPEAEWGFEPTLRKDAERFAAERGFRVRRLVFREPEDLSPVVADLYRWWYRERGISSRRLLGESFVLVEPWWALRTGSVPFWCEFNGLPSVRSIEAYLDSAEPFDEIGITLMSHGVESAGMASIERWRSVLSRGRYGGRFLGFDEEKYPKDLGVYARYHQDLRRLSPRFPIPEPLALRRFDAFLERASGRYAFSWV